MTWFLIGLAILTVLYFTLWIPGAGKFWHKHQWYHYMSVETPSMYSNKKVNNHTVWRCSRDNCWAFNIDVTTMEKNERVQT